MIPESRRQVGNTKLRIPLLGLGGSALGGLRTDQSTSNADANAAYDAAWHSNFRYYDTAPLYGAGRGEHRLGRMIREHPRNAFVLSTKVGMYGWPATTSDYGYDRTLKSIDESLERLGTDWLDIVFIHNIDPGSHGPSEWKNRFKEAIEGAYPALCKLKSDGVIGAIGVGVNSSQVCIECLRAAEFDVFMLAGQYTLLQQSALKDLLPECKRSQVSIILAAPFNSGILASGAHPGARYSEEIVTPDVLQKVRDIEAICDDFGVSLGAAALQFPLSHPSVASVLPGPRSSEQVRCNRRWFDESIPPDFWEALIQGRLLPANTLIFD
jgi:D-threo-aldose 1-dehydrogenase